MGGAGSGIASRWLLGAGDSERGNIHGRFLAEVGGKLGSKFPKNLAT